MSTNGHGADITIGGGRPERLVADFLGREFEVQRVTKPLAKAIEEAEAVFHAAVSPDEVVAAVGGLLDLYLKPVGAQKTKPSKLLADRWEAGETDLGEVTGYYQNTQTVALAPPPLTR